MGFFRSLDIVCVWPHKTIKFLFKRKWTHLKVNWRKSSLHNFAYTGVQWVTGIYRSLSGRDATRVKRRFAHSKKTLFPSEIEQKDRLLFTSSPPFRSRCHTSTVIKQIKTATEAHNTAIDAIWDVEASSPFLRPNGTKIIILIINTWIEDFYK